MRPVSNVPETGEERERERDRRKGLADPGACRQLILRQLDGQIQQCRAVALEPLGSLLRETGDELLQYHHADDGLGVAASSQQPFAARVPELLCQDKGLAGWLF